MSKSKERITGRAYEELIFKIYKELEPLATIKKNDKIHGFDSGGEREIDISIRQSVAGHNILIIIQAKDQKRSADVNIVGAFDSVIRDVRAARGILICNTGFTKKAKQYAINKGIDLCTAHDAASKDWTTEIKIPVVRTQTRITYALRSPVKITEYIKEKHPSATVQVKLGQEGFVMTKEDGTEISFLQEFSQLWNEGKIDTSEGVHLLTMNSSLVLFADKEVFAPAKAELEYTIKKRSYFKLFTPDDYRGIKDYVTKKFRPSFISIKDSIPFINDKSWKYIEYPSQLSLDTVWLEIDVVEIDRNLFVRGVLRE